MPRNILIVVESYVRWLFYSRMRHSIENMGYKLFYLTTCPSVFAQAKNEGAPIKLVDKYTRAYDAVINEKVYLETLDVKSGELTPHGAERVARTIFGNLDELTQTFKPDSVFIYNGTTIFGAVVGGYARQNGIATAYFELANLPGKMFVDPEGTGAHSRLYRNPGILNACQCNMAEFNSWRKDFIKRKLENGFVPQVTHGKNSLKDYGYYTIDKLYFSHLAGEKKSYVSAYVDKFANAFLRKQQLQYDEEVNLSIKPYLFYPMQVSQDSQILLHSQTDNIRAISKAYELAREYGAELIVKPHPAEADKTHLAKICDLKQELGFKLTGINTMKLITSSEAVVTINSTVGLEAKIAGKKVHTLGRAYYATFDDTALARYVQDYLVPVDYFSSEAINEGPIKKILGRAEACKQETLRQRYKAV